MNIIVLKAWKWYGKVVTDEISDMYDKIMHMNWSGAVWSVIVILAVVGMMVGLYETGLTALHRKRAVVYIGPSDGTKARFTHCTGKVSRVIRQKYDHAVTIRLNAVIEKGQMELLLYNRNREVIVQLDQHHTEEIVFLRGSHRYILEVRFDHASGQYRYEII